MQTISYLVFLAFSLYIFKDNNYIVWFLLISMLFVNIKDE